MAAKTLSFYSGNEPFYVFGLQHRTPLALSSDNERIVYVDTENHFNIVDGMGNKVSTIRAATKAAYALQFSHDDQLLIVGVAEGLMIFEIATKKMLFNIQRSQQMHDMHEGAVTALVAYGTTLITGGQDSDMRVWYLGKHDEAIHYGCVYKSSLSQQSGGYQLSHLVNINAHKTQVNKIIKSPTQNRVATFAADNSTKIWDLSNERGQPEQIALLNAHRSDVLCASFSDDGRMIVTGARDNTVIVWDANSFTVLRSFIAHKSDITFVTFCQQDKFLMVGSFSGSLKLMRVPDFSAELETKAEGIETQLVIPEVSKLIKAAERNQEVFETVSEFQAQDREMYAVILGSRKPILITAQQQHFIRIWDAQNLTAPVLKREIFSHMDQINSMCHVDASLFATCSRDGSFALLDYLKGDKRLSIKLQGSLSAICFHQEAQDLYVANYQYEVFGFHIMDNQPPLHFCTLVGHRGTINNIVFTGSALITSAGDSQIMTWPVPQFNNEQQPKEIKYAQKFRFAPAIIQRMNFSNGILTFAAANHSLFSARVTGTNIKIITEVKCAHAASILGVGNNGNLVYSCSVDGSIKAWPMNPVKSKTYNPTKGVISTTGTDEEKYKLYNNSSSALAQHVLILPRKYGLPNCMAVTDSAIAVGTTSGEIVTLTPELQPVFFYDNDGAETISSILLISDKIIAGLRKGSVQIWDKTSLVEEHEDVFVFGSR